MVTTPRRLDPIGKGEHMPAGWRVWTTSQPHSPRRPDAEILLLLSDRIHTATQARQEGPESEDDQNAIDGGDGEQDGNCGGLHGGSSQENRVR